MEVLATICFLLALVRMSFADVSAVMQALPLVVTFGAAVFLKEPVGWRRWAAILVGFVGVMIIIRPGFAGFQPAMILMVFSVVFAAIRDLITKSLPATVHSYWVTVATAILVALFGLSATTVLQQWTSVTRGNRQRCPVSIHQPRVGHRVWFRCVRGNTRLHHNAGFGYCRGHRYLRLESRAKASETGIAVAQGLHDCVNCRAWMIKTKKKRVTVNF